MAPLLNKHGFLNLFASVFGLSNEALCILVAQVTAKLSNVKNGGLKKNSSAQPDLQHSKAAFLIFFRISNFNLW